MNNNQLIYGTGAVLFGIFVFIIIWIYAVMQWGLLLGLALGWFPAIIGALIFGLLWPVIACVIAILVGWYLLKK